MPRQRHGKVPLCKPQSDRFAGAGALELSYSFRRGRTRAPVGPLRRAKSESSPIPGPAHSSASKMQLRLSISDLPGPKRWHVGAPFLGDHHRKQFPFILSFHMYAWVKIHKAL